MSAPFPTDASSPQPYVEMANAGALTPQEVRMLRLMLQQSQGQNQGQSGSPILPTESQDSEYTEFMESTHAWAVFADNPNKRATMMDRTVGIMVIVFQCFTYYLFAMEAIEDYESGEVAVMTGHANCLAKNGQPYEEFTCEAEFTNDFDAFVAFFMLGIFLAGDFLQAGRVIRKAPTATNLAFACLAGFEVVAAYVAACIAVSYNLYIGEVTDAVEVGVGLLFIRELSQRAYSGIRNGKVKQYRSFFIVLAVLVAIGMASDPLCERLFAVKDE